MGDPKPDIQEWVTAVGRLLGLDGLGDDEGLVDAVLDLTADVAHGVSRPAAPVTAFLVGLAMGRADDPAAALRSHTAAVSALAAAWPVA
ncbi:MAG: hypothetical protein H0X35_11860 [Pseudonocardiales bacterium]|nr:hypothetical protein [Pseudonocardiales bacterium]